MSEVDDKEKAAFDLTKATPSPHAFIQWKGTNICMDFHCLCGALGHFDGYFAYRVKCQHCGRLYQMPSNVFPRLIEDKDDGTPFVTVQRDDDP